MSRENLPEKVIAEQMLKGSKEGGHVTLREQHPGQQEQQVLVGGSLICLTNSTWASVARAE